MNCKELVFKTLKNDGFEDDIINEFIAEVNDWDFKETLYLVDFGGKKALIPESYLVVAE